jgi:hypothetical protein
MEWINWIVFVRGLVITAFLSAIGLSIGEWQWWVAMLSLSVAFALTRYA